MGIVLWFLIGGIILTIFGLLSLFGNNLFRVEDEEGFLDLPSGENNFVEEFEKKSNERKTAFIWAYIFLIGGFTLLQFFPPLFSNDSTMILKIGIAIVLTLAISIITKIFATRSERNEPLRIARSTLLIKLFEGVENNNIDELMKSLDENEQNALRERLEKDPELKKTYKMINSMDSGERRRFIERNKKLVGQLIKE